MGRFCDTSLEPNWQVGASMDFEDLYRRTKTGDPGCDSYYCSTCGGQAGRVEKALKRTNIDGVYNYLMDIDISEYLQQDTAEERRMFLQHLLEGAGWSEPVLSVQQREAVSGQWRKRTHGNEYRQLDAIFEFIDYNAYLGRSDDFDIDIVMSKHGGQCENRDGRTVRIVSVENPGEFPILGAVVWGLEGEEEILEYRIDGSNYIDWCDDLVMPDAED